MQRMMWISLIFHPVINWERDGSSTVKIDGTAATAKELNTRVTDLPAGVVILLTLGILSGS